jgi:phosphoglycolate phosphatase-like HAD superfamily hydrolase
MYKTIIFRLEGVLLNEEIFKFKIYELLWYYMRRNPENKSFKQLLELRNRYAAKTLAIPPYHLIIRNHLSEIDQSNILTEIALLERKLSNRYLRKVPGIMVIIQNLKYYYKIYLLARDSTVTRNAVKKFGWKDQIYYLKSGDGSVNPSYFRDSLLQIIKLTRAETSETIFIGEFEFPDIQVARQSGISTIRTDFSFRSKGFAPQNIMERQYVSAIEEKSPAGPLDFLRKPFEPGLSVKNPDQLVKRIQDLEENRPTIPEYQKIEDKTNMWDIAKKILNPPIEPDN